MSQKQTLIKFLKNKTTSFTIDEINAVINIINTLEDVQPKVAEEPKKKK